jgi:hypothetical protein
MKDEMIIDLMARTIDPVAFETPRTANRKTVQNRLAAQEVARRRATAALQVYKAAISSAGYVLMPREATLELSNISAEYFGGSYNEWLEMWAALVSSQEGKR